jgi:arsenical resistance operon trans-acting repressor ArsD
MTKLQVFDPPMCCSSGVCGPNVDPALPRFAADLEWLKSKGIQVERVNLAQDPGAFVRNPALKQALDSEGMKCLPVVLLDGEVISSSAYPARQELARLTGVQYEPGPAIKPRATDLVGIEQAAVNERRRS